MYTLYEYRPSGNSYKVHLLFHELGLEHKNIHLDILAGESRTPEFLAKNPTGQIPVLEMECGRTLSQSVAILWYLADGTDLLPADPWDRAKVMQWMVFEQHKIEVNVAEARFLLHSLGKTPDELGEKLTEKQEKGYQALGILEEGLCCGDWLVGGQFSIADIALYGYTHVAGDGGFDLAKYPRISAWIQRIEARPNFIAMEPL